VRKLLTAATMIGLLAFAPAALGAGSLPPGFITDTLGPGGHSKLAPSPPIITDTLVPGGGTRVQSYGASSSSRFNWADAMIGAAGAVGLVLVVFGGVLVRLRTRGAVAA
jgi:hypothetical protein